MKRTPQIQHVIRRDRRLADAANRAIDAALARPRVVSHVAIELRQMADAIEGGSYSMVVANHYDGYPERWRIDVTLEKRAAFPKPGEVEQAFRDARKGET